MHIYPTRNFVKKTRKMLKATCKQTKITKWKWNSDKMRSYVNNYHTSTRTLVERWSWTVSLNVVMLLAKIYIYTTSGVKKTGCGICHSDSLWGMFILKTLFPFCHIPESIALVSRVYVRGQMTLPLHPYYTRCTHESRMLKNMPVFIRGSQQDKNMHMP